VEILIDRRELLEKSRERGLRLEMIEKDYVLGWLLYGFSQFPNLVFKGGTALSKVYFPRIWRLSEDLDFSLVQGEMPDVMKEIEAIILSSSQKSGIEFNLKSSHLIPEYLQLKIQYKGLISRNWIKVDCTLDDLVEKPAEMELKSTYSDYIPFKIRVETLEEIFASKLRAAIERKKCRDYFDLWQLSKMDFDNERLKDIFARKCKIKNIEFQGLAQIFPEDIVEKMAPYWQRELSRLTNLAPEMDIVISALKKSLEFLE
jgi:predicted nucleotidyltransferase component of viral defense system